MANGPRLAIYFVPPAETALYLFGASVLGYDAYTGADAAFFPAASTDWPELTKEPRLYGFHATLKAPFHLADNAREDDVTAELARFAAIARPTPALDLDVAALGSFLALAPRTPSEALQRLAAACVEHFDCFRRPLSDHDLARRRAAGLTARQEALLVRWGYPYVFDEFRFHMTLTGALPPERQTAIATALRSAWAAASDGETISVGQIALARQDEPGARFRICAAMALTPKR